MVVFWKEDSGCQHQLITPENEGGNETSSPSQPNFTFLDDPDVLLGPSPPPGPPDPPGLPPGWPPAPPLAGEREKKEPKVHRVSDHVRDLHHRSLN